MIGGLVALQEKNFFSFGNRLKTFFQTIEILCSVPTSSPPSSAAAGEPI